MKFGEAICALLRARNVDTVFGIPGVHTIELFRNLAGHGLELVVPRHEQGAGFMADGYARATAKPGVCFLVTGPGVLNALTPIAQAWHDSQPMLIIASTVETAQVGQHRGTLHDTPDIADTLRPYTLFSRNVATIEEFRDSLEEAYALWATGRPRPVYLGVPIDILSTDVVLPEVRVGIPAAQPGPEPSDVEHVAKLLDAAQAPVIIAGGGCRAHGELLDRLARNWDAPVVLTANSKGLLSEDNPLNLELSTPFEGTRALLESADAVLAIGTELSDVEYIFTGSAPAKLHNVIRVDLDPGVGHPDQTRPTIGSEAGEFMKALLAHAPAPGTRNTSATGVRRAAEAKRLWAAEKDADPYREWVEALHRGLPNQAIVAADSAQLAYQAHQFMPLPAGTTWMAPYGLGTLGPAIPMAVGAAVSAPRRPVLALAGDGSSLFSIAELATAADLGRQLTVVIWVNDGYKEIEASFDRAGLPAVGVRTSAPDFPALVRGLGGEPVVVRDPASLTAALHRATATAHLTVILVDAPDALRVGAAARLT
jgi:thiamine pyrophosphate-dependent acetolactate synthase large subunit-like protein